MDRDKAVADILDTGHHPHTHLEAPHTVQWEDWGEVAQMEWKGALLAGLGRIPHAEQIYVMPADPT